MAARALHNTSPFRGSRPRLPTEGVKPLRNGELVASELWPMDKLVELASLWKQGYSANAIATKMGNGLTRNAVMGQVHRQGLHRQTGLMPKRVVQEVRPRRALPPPPQIDEADTSKEWWQCRVANCRGTKQRPWEFCADHLRAKCASIPTQRRRPREESEP